MVKKESKPNFVLRLIVVSCALVLIIILMSRWISYSIKNIQRNTMQISEEEPIIPFYDNDMNDEKTISNEEIVKKANYRNLTMWAVKKINNMQLISQEMDTEEEQERMTREKMKIVEKLLEKGKDKHTAYIRKKYDSPNDIVAIPALSLAVNNSFFNSKCIEYMLIRADNAAERLKSSNILGDNREFICSPDGDLKMFEWLMLDQQENVKNKMLEIFKYVDHPFLTTPNEDLNSKRLKNRLKRVLKSFSVYFFNIIAWNPTYAIKNKIVGASNRKIENVMDECIKLFKFYYVMEDIDKKLLNLEQTNKRNTKEYTDLMTDKENIVNTRKKMTVSKATDEENLVCELLTLVTDVHCGLALSMNIYIQSLVSAFKDARLNMPIDDRNNLFYKILFEAPIHYYRDSTTSSMYYIKTLTYLTQIFNKQAGEDDLEKPEAKTNLAEKNIAHLEKLQIQQERSLASVLYLIEALLGRNCCKFACEGAGKCLIEAIDVTDIYFSSQIQLYNIEFDLLSNIIIEQKIALKKKSIVGYLWSYVSWSNKDAEEVQKDVENMEKTTKLLEIKSLVIKNVENMHKILVQCI